MEFLDNLSNINEMLMNFLDNAGVWAPILSSILIILEGTLAFLPLFVFVTLNVLTMGPIFGSIISWICTTVGSFIAFYLCRKGFSSFFQNKLKEQGKLKKIMRLVDNLKFKQLVLIIAIPFAPSFFINVAAGLSNISIKKYFYSLLVGKVFVIIFLAYIGSNILECFTNPIVIVKVVLLLVGAYVLAQIVNKKFDLDGKV